jgi:tripartite-type tricarboxylate transporter receptor subunit TctC
LEGIGTRSKVCLCACPYRKTGVPFSGTLAKPPRCGEQLCMGHERASALPKVATLIESGFPGLEANAWWGFFAPAGTPRPIVDRFGAEVAAVLGEDRIRKQLAESQQVRFVLGGPDELGKFVHEQMQTWGAVVRENGITAE